MALSEKELNRHPSVSICGSFKAVFDRLSKKAQDTNEDSLSSIEGPNLNASIGGNFVTTLEWQELRKNKSLAEIGIIYGVSRQRAHQVECYLLDKPMPAQKRRAKKLPKALPPEQVERLLSVISRKSATGKRNLAAYQTMYKAGLRVSEVCHLTPADVDLKKGSIYVQNGKGGRDRHIPIGATLVGYLKAWDIIRPQQSVYFFCTHQGGQLSERYLNTALRRYSELSGVFIQDGEKSKPVSCHKLRHSYATDLLSSGQANIRQVQELLGHSSVATTQVYTHVTQEELNAIIKARG